MGNLIKVLGKDLENCPHFFLDFESKFLLGVWHSVVWCVFLLGVWPSVGVVWCVVCVVFVCV